MKYCIECGNKLTTKYLEIEAKWFSFEDAKSNIKKDSLAEYFLSK